jgi:hypothetical protein
MYTAASGNSGLQRDIVGIMAPRRLDGTRFASYARLGSIYRASSTTNYVDPSGLSELTARSIGA